MSPKESLQKPEAWDWDKAETRAPIRNRRVVLSVAFKSPDFQRVSSYAAQIGKRASEFVRDAAIQAVPETHPKVLPFTRVTASTTSRGPKVTSNDGDVMTSPALQYQVR